MEMDDALLQALNGLQAAEQDAGPETQIKSLLQVSEVLYLRLQTDAACNYLQQALLLAERGGNQQLHQIRLKLAAISFWQGKEQLAFRYLETCWHNMQLMPDVLKVETAVLSARWFHSQHQFIKARFWLDCSLKFDSTSVTTSLVRIELYGAAEANITNSPSFTETPPDCIQVSLWRLLTERRAWQDFTRDYTAKLEQLSQHSPPHTLLFYRLEFARQAISTNRIALARDHLLVTASLIEQSGLEFFRSELEQMLTSISHEPALNDTASQRPLAEPVSVDARFYIRSRLAVNSNCITSLAWDRKTYKNVIIKQFIAPPNLDSAQWQSLWQEASTELKVARGIRTPLIATPLAIGQDGSGLPFIVREYIAGSTLDKMMSKVSELPSIISYADKIANALSHLHHLSIVHRDLKPANLIVRPNGDICLIDLGSAVFNQQIAAPQGTKPYMAPEQAETGGVDQRTDIFALATILLEWLTLDGHGAGHGIAVSGEVLKHRLKAQPRPLRNLLRDCLSIDVASRPADIMAFKVRLGRVLTG